ncbi:MAG: hypothetical protein JRJ85_15145, partial [Deltaproteobacteria bacterium]|nr:hypothetical protein [Deltaproteobacteria bacterium]
MKTFLYSSLCVLLILAMGIAAPAQQEELSLFTSDCSLLIHVNVKQLLSLFPSDISQPLRTQLSQLIGSNKLGGLDSMTIGVGDGFFSGERGSLGVVMKSDSGIGTMGPRPGGGTIKFGGLLVGRTDDLTEEELEAGALDVNGGTESDDVNRDLNEETVEDGSQTLDDGTSQEDQEMDAAINAAADAGVAQRSHTARVSGDTWVTGNLYALQNFSAVISGRTGSGSSNSRLIRTLNDADPGGVLTISGAFPEPVRDQIFGDSPLKRVLDSFSVNAGADGDGVSIHMTFWPVDPGQIGLL